MVFEGHRDVAELLLENVANRDCRTKTGITPLFQVTCKHHSTMYGQNIETLLNYMYILCSISFNVKPFDRRLSSTLRAWKKLEFQVVLWAGSSTFCLPSDTSYLS